MVSVFIFFSDEAITETETKINSLSYILNPNGKLMNSVCIQPAENLIMHLTDTLKDNNIILTLKDSIENLGLDKIKKYLNKTSEEIEVENIYILIDNEENIKGSFKYDIYFKYGVDKSLVKLIPLLNTEYFTFIADFNYKDDISKNAMLNFINRTISTEYDIVINTGKQIGNSYEDTKILYKGVPILLKSLI